MAVAPSTAWQEGCRRPLHVPKTAGETAPTAEDRTRMHAKPTAAVSADGSLSFGKARSLVVLAACEVLALSLWFSASAVVPVLKAQYGIGGGQAAALSSSVALGFVAGTLFSAVLGLADRLDPRAFFTASALLGAAANSAAVLLAPTSIGFVVLRFVVGATIAGIYPVGIKMAATWAMADLGLLVGLLVAASTLGNATAFLLAAFGDVDWRETMLGASGLATMAAILILLFRTGPRLRPASMFRAHYVLDAWRQRPLRLANLGYYGHMWELYALWTWVAAFLQASFQTTPLAIEAPFWAKLGAFATIGFGALGCLVGGVLADRFGRTSLTIGAMLLSGGCALLAGFLFGGPPWLLTGFCVFWGTAAIADSAQFSASVVELSDPERVGTMVTVQTCVGFLLTMVSIHLVPAIDAAVGWRWALAFLSVGPFLGAWAMWRLRHEPASVKLAAGRR
jgi:MFS family permease